MTINPKIADALSTLIADERDGRLVAATEDGTDPFAEIRQRYEAGQEAVARGNADLHAAYACRAIGIATQALVSGAIRPANSEDARVYLRRLTAGVPTIHISERHGEVAVVEVGSGAAQTGSTAAWAVGRLIGCHPEVFGMRVTLTDGKNETLSMGAADAPRTVTVKVRENDYMAYLDGDTRIWDAGRDPWSAIGALVRTHPEYAGLVVALPPPPVEPAPEPVRRM